MSEILKTTPDGSCTNGASPQLENGYTRIANELIEVLMRTNLSKYQSRVLWAVWRLTYGYQKKSEWITNSKLAEMTGIHKSHVSRTVSELLARNIVANSGNKIAFNKDYQVWSKLPIRVTVTRSGNKVTDWGYRSLPVGVTQVPGRQIQEGKSRTVKKERNKEKKIYSPNFITFYELYPRHEAKHAAFQAWQKIDTGNGTLDTILQALEKQIAHKDCLKETGQFCPDWPMPATWLNGRRWEDEISILTKTEESGPSTKLHTDPIERAKQRMGL